VATNRSENFATNLARGLRSVTQSVWDGWPEAYSKIFNVQSGDGASLDDSSVTGLPLFSETGAGTAVTYETVYQGYKKTYTYVTYKMGYRATEQLQKDDLYGPMRRMARSLGVSSRQTIETVAANVFNNGFSTVGPDGKVLFATDHPLEGGGDEQNRPTTAVDLGETALQEAINLCEATVDPRGLYVGFTPRLLVVHRNDRWTAAELLKSQMDPENANNAYNSLREMDLTYYVYQYLTDADAWFLLGDKEEHQLNFIWRWKLKQGDEVDFDTDDIKMKGSMRFDVGYSGWRHVFGSPGQ